MDHGRAGLTLVAEMMHTLGMPEVVAGEVKSRRRRRGFEEAAFGLPDP
jgi:hypothetical protein